MNTASITHDTPLAGARAYFLGEKESEGARFLKLSAIIAEFMPPESANISGVRAGCGAADARGGFRPRPDCTGGYGRRRVPLIFISFSRLATIVIDGVITDELRD